MSQFKLVEQFCLIQLQVLSDREKRLRKELQDCTIQREYIAHFLSELGHKEQFAEFAGLIIGIFAEALSNIDVFSSNIYLTHMLSASLVHHHEIQEEYNEAVAQDNAELIEKKEMELKICEGNFALASAMFDYWEKVYS